MDEANGDKNKLTVKINQNRQYSPLSALQSALCVRVLFLISEGSQRAALKFNADKLVRLRKRAVCSLQMSLVPFTCI